MLNELLAVRGIPPSSLYCLPDVARILGITQPSIRRLIRHGLLKAIRRRRSIIGITHPALEAYLSGDDEMPSFVAVKHEDLDEFLESLSSEVQHA